MKYIILIISITISQISYSQQFDYDSAAQSFIKFMNEGKVKEIHSLLSSSTQKVLSEDRLKLTWGAIKKQIGEFESMETSQVTTNDTLMVSKTPCVFTVAPVLLQLTYTKNYKIAGLRILPPEAPKSAYKPAGYIDADAYIEKNIVIPSEAGPLPGTFTMPKDINNFPIVIIIHGSGPQDQDGTMGDNKPYKDLALGLANQGIASIRYTKRSKAHPGYFNKPFTVQELVVDDALEAIKIANSITEGKIFALGHSLGGMLIPKIVSQTDLLDGAIIMAGNARPIYELVIEQTEYLAKEPNTSKAKLDELEKLKKAAIRIKNKDYDKNTAKEDLIYSPPSYWDDIRDYDPIEVAEKLTIPVLVVQGERDYQVTMSSDFSLWKDNLNGDNTTFKSYSKLNHLMLEGEGKPNSKEYKVASNIPEYFIEDLTSWIKK